jgi:16S rRNA (uracil1498-N3)-methyltransferase
MTRRRFIADEISGDRAALSGKHAAHLVRVLRVRVGQEFDIATGSNPNPSVRRGRVTRIADDRVEFELGEEVSPVSAVNLILVLAIFKFDRMEWAIEKCTELGVSQIVPVIAQRTDAHLAAASAKRVERWRRIALQASEQSRRAAPPEVAAPAELTDVTRAANGIQIVLAESERETFLRDVIDCATSRNETTFAIGPEGGWTGDELQRFQQAGWIPASLGNTILRSETAAIAATAIVTSALG